MPDYSACTTAFEANAYIERCLDAPLVGLDTETTGIDRWHDTLVGICLSAAPGEGRYIPIAHTADGAPNVDLRDIGPLLALLLTSRPLSTHNAPFEAFILWRALTAIGQSIADPVEWHWGFDSLLAAQCLGERSEAGNDKSAGLKALAKKYLGVERPAFEDLFPPKTKPKDRNFASLDVDIAVPYAAADADDTLTLVDVLHGHLHNYDVLATFNLEMKLLPEMLWMEHRGVVLDEQNSHEQEQRCHEFANTVETMILDHFRERIGKTHISIERKRKGEKVMVEEELVLKDSHLKVILHDPEYLGLPVMGTTPKGDISLNEEAIEKLASHEPACRWLLEVRGARKAASTYFNGWRDHVVYEPVFDEEEALDAPHGAENAGMVELAILHPNYKQYGTETGRASSSDPNTQNAPKEQTFGEHEDKATKTKVPMIPDVDPIVVNTRDQIVPRPGHYFLEMDWAQVEARVIAGFSQEPTLLDVFKRGIDYHKATYGVMYGVDPDTVTKEQRGEGKTLNYALGFGGGPDLLAGMLGCSLDDAREKIARYWSGLPHYAAWKASIEEFAEKNRFVATAFGRKRFLDFGGSNIDQKAARRAWFAALREAVNTPIQGTAADLLKIMLCRVGPYIRQYLPGVRTVFTTHDSVTFEVPNTYDPHWLCDVLDPVCRFDEGFLPGWPEISCDFEWGDRWGSLSEDDDDAVEDEAPVEQSLPAPPAEIEPAPVERFVLSIDPSSMNDEVAGNLRNFLIGLQGGDNVIVLQVGDQGIEWPGMDVREGDGHLFAHILDPEMFRLTPEQDLSLLAGGAA